jgi:hypothetical protein
MLKKNKRAKPKIRKANSVEARYIRAARSIVRDTALAYCHSMKAKGVTLVSLKEKVPYTLSSTIQRALNDVKYNWRIYIGLLCRDQKGQEYIQGRWVVTNEPYHHEQIIPAMNNYHQELIAEANARHLIDFCWLALPNHEEVDEPVIDQIFANLGAWEYLAQWEQDKLTKEQAA